MIILTGGAGFIGSCILKRLNQVGASDILVVDHLGLEKKKQNLENKKYQDYMEKDVFLRLIVDGKLDKKIDFVIHMGACTSTIMEDKNYMFANNYEYSVSLAKWALSKNTSFLYASSAATYGDGSFGFSDEDVQTYKLKPLNIYGYSKHLFDLWVLDNKLIDKVTGFKFFNVFGPNEYHKGPMRSLICKRFDGVKKEGKIQLFKSYKEGIKDGQQKRDFIYIKDAVDIVYYFLEHPDKCGIYNVGTGKARSWNDVAEAMFSYFGKEANIEYVDMPEVLKGKYQYYTQADMNKLRSAGYDKEFYSLEDSVKEYAGFLDRHDYL